MVSAYRSLQSSPELNNVGCDALNPISKPLLLDHLQYHAPYESDCAHGNKLQSVDKMLNAACSAAFDVRTTLLSGSAKFLGNGAIF